MGEEGERLGLIGIIADTHGLLRPEVLEVFANADAIIHAGDIGGAHVLDALRAVAPVTYVGGNNDEGSDGTEIVRANLGGMRILVTHILPRPGKVRGAVARSLQRAPADLVVFGHSHLPHHETIGGVTFFNPASAGPRRFDYPTAVGLLDGGTLRHVPLDERSVTALTKRMNQLS